MPASLNASVYFNRERSERFSALCGQRTIAVGLDIEDQRVDHFDLVALYDSLENELFGRREPFVHESSCPRRKAKADGVPFLCGIFSLAFLCFTLAKPFDPHSHWRHQLPTE